MSTFQHSQTSGVVIIDPHASGNTTASTVASTVIRVPKGAEPTMTREQIESAVYSYIQAVRALGVTKITADEIASALGIPVDEVERAGVALRTKGVKRA